MNYPTECFPAWQVHYEKPAVENLIEFGSFGNANITNNLYHSNNINFEFQKLHGTEGEHKLSAKNSTLPFLPPNIDKLEADPCLQETSDYRKLLMKYNDYLIHYKVHIRQNYKEHKEFHQFYLDLKKCTKKANYTLTLKPWLEKFVKTKLELERQQEKNLRFATSNWLYSGGCLSFLKNPKDSSSGFLFHASGAKLDTLTVTPIRAIEDLLRSPFMVEACVDEEQFFPIKRPIYQVHSALCDTNGFCLVRSQDSISLFQLTSTGIFLQKDIYEGIGDLTSVAVSPYIPAEYVLASKDGAIYCRDAELKRCDVIYDGVERVPTVEKWWQCSYGAHPQCLMVASRSSFHRKDIRISKSTTELFAFPNIHVTSEDLLYQTLQHPRNDFQHFLATTHNLILLDERYPKMSLLQWKHFLKTPPLYCSATVDVLENNQDIVVLASQESQETVCFQTGVTSHNAPSSTCSPWRMAAIDKFFKRQALIDHSDFVNQRLMVPLIGLCSVPHILKGFTAIVMSCYGDVFGQSFFSSSSNFNEICDDINAPYASCEGDTSLLYFNNWLQRLKERKLEASNGAELVTNRTKFMNSGDKSENCEDGYGSSPDEFETSEKVSMSVHHGDQEVSCGSILPILNSFSERVTSHESCSLCLGETVASGPLTGCEFCSSCGMSLTESKQLKKCAQKGLVLEEPYDQTSNNFSLDFIDLSLSQDPVSKSLLKLWQDEEFEEEMPYQESDHQSEVDQPAEDDQPSVSALGDDQNGCSQPAQSQDMFNEQIVSQEIVSQDIESQMFSMMAIPEMTDI